MRARSETQRRAPARAQDSWPLPRSQRAELAEYTAQPPLDAAHLPPRRARERFAAAPHPNRSRRTFRAMAGSSVRLRHLARVAHPADLFVLAATSPNACACTVCCLLAPTSTAQRRAPAPCPGPTPPHPHAPARSPPAPPYPRSPPRACRRVDRQEARRFRLAPGAARIACRPQYAEFWAAQRCAAAWERFEARHGSRRCAEAPITPPTQPRPPLHCPPPPLRRCRRCAAVAAVAAAAPPSPPPLSPPPPR